MASIYGYSLMIIGLSLLLAFAGINSGVGALQNVFYSQTTNQTSGEVTHDFVNLNQFKNNFFETWQTLFVLGGTIIGLGVAWATRDLGQAIKSGMATVIGGLVITDFVSLLTYDFEGTFGTLIKVISLVIYLPLTVGFFFTVANWIGGGE